MKKLSVIFLLLIATGTALADDTIVFKNGDILTGTILEQDSERIYFRSDEFGAVSLNTRNILEIQIEMPMLGEVAIPASAITTPEPTKPNTSPPLANPLLAQQESQPSLSDNFKEENQWTGQSGLSIAMRESNTLRRYGTNLVEKTEAFESYRIYGNVNWKGERNNLRWDWTYRYSRSDIRKNDDFFNVTQNYQHEFTEKYFARSKTLYQRDFRRGIESEYLQTAEFGVKWFHQPKLKLSTSIGAGYHQYDRIQSKYSDSQGKFIVEQSLRWQMINSLTLFQKYTHLGNLDKYHFIFSSGLENKLIQNIFLRLEYRLDRDTDVNYSDSGFYDKALLTSLLYKF